MDLGRVQVCTNEGREMLLKEGGERSKLSRLIANLLQLAKQGREKGANLLQPANEGMEGKIKLASQGGGEGFDLDQQGADSLQPELLELQ